MTPPEDDRLFCEAAARNAAPLLEVLRGVLPPSGLMLEVASGTGQHAARGVEAFPGWRWQPSEVDPSRLASIEAYRRAAGAENFLAPLRLDVAARPWPVTRADAVLVVNLTHISPWAATLGLLAGAAEVLPPGAPLVVYGPFKVGGEAAPESNRRFDVSLRQRDPRWGLRDMEVVEEEASRAGLEPEARHPMPANNWTLVLRRR